MNIAEHWALRVRDYLNLYINLNLVVVEVEIDRYQLSVVDFLLKKRSVNVDLVSNHIISPLVDDCNQMVFGIFHCYRKGKSIRACLIDCNKRYNVIVIPMV